MGIVLTTKKNEKSDVRVTVSLPIICYNLLNLSNLNLFLQLYAMWSPVVILLSIKNRVARRGLSGANNCYIFDKFSEFSIFFKIGG